jgi:hypothetical protein
MRVYAEATTYLEGMELAAKDESIEKSLRNALNNAIRVFKLNKQRITDGQKDVGDRDFDAKVVTFSHVIYFGNAAEGGIKVAVEKK